MKVAVALCLVLVTANPLVKAVFYDSSCDVPDGTSQSCVVTFCRPDDSYDLQGMKISFSQDPMRGHDVTIRASGTLSKEVTGGSIKVVAKYSFFSFTSFTILDKSYDVCDLVLEIGEQCPLPAGPISGSITTKIPGYAPPGKYHVEISGTDQSGGKLVCGQATCNL